MQEIGEGGQIWIRQNLQPYLVSKQAPYNADRRSQNSLSITHMHGAGNFYARLPPYYPAEILRG